MFGVYAGSFSGNLATDVVLTQRIDGNEFRSPAWCRSAASSISSRIHYPTYAAFSDGDDGPAVRPAGARSARSTTRPTASPASCLHNDGGGAFSATALPTLAQIAPIKAIVVHDFDGDGNLDLLVAGNLYEAEPNTPRADAGNGLWLRGDGQGRFVPVSPRASGFLAPHDVAGLALLDTPTGRAVLVANTGDSLQVFAVRKPSSSTKRVAAK